MHNVCNKQDVKADLLGILALGYTCALASRLATSLYGQQSQCTKIRARGVTERSRARVVNHDHH